MDSFIQRVTSGRPEATRTHVYHGRSKMVMNLVPEIYSIFARSDIERAKLDAFLQLFDEEYPIKEFRVDGNDINLVLTSSKAPSKAFMDKLRRREFFVYHLKYNAEDWEQEQKNNGTFFTRKTLSAQIDRYEGIKVRDWIAPKSLIFGTSLHRPTHGELQQPLRT